MKYKFYTNLIMLDNMDSDNRSWSDANEEYEEEVNSFFTELEDKPYTLNGKTIELDYCEFDEDIIPYVYVSGCESEEDALAFVNDWSKKFLVPFLHKTLDDLREKYDLEIEDDEYLGEFELDEDDLDESCNFNKKRGKKMKDSKITKEMLDEAIEVAEAHGYKVVDESAKAEKSKKELIAEAIEVAKAHGYKVVKEDEEPGATAETPETGAESDGEEQEIFTIQVTKEELEAIKSILDKVEYEDDGSADAEAAAAVVSAMDNENIYGPADE